MSENKNNDIGTENLESPEITENTGPVEPIEADGGTAVDKPADPVKITESVEPVDTGGIDIDVSKYMPDFSPEKKKKKSGFNFKDSVFGTAAILGIIAVAMAFMLALFNSLTAPVIARRMADETGESVADFFGERTYYETLAGFEDIYSEFGAPVTEVLIVRENQTPLDKIVGYCVKVTPQGFGGKITMLVAVNPNITVKDTKILSMSETVGIGSKINGEDWFREQFKYKAKNIKESKTEIRSGENAVNTIAGATKSSKAFLSGVNAALDAAGEINRRIKETERAASEKSPDGSDETEESGPPADREETKGPESPDENAEKEVNPDE